ncbi:MAG TPA: helix-turn-helix domain-containing protein [Myxococcota bacterium]|jgi:curved DNA-binding protein CbpA
MKPLSEQDHYETLEVTPEAGAEEIERAYRLARATYADDSLAGYSVFDQGDAAAIRERIETAFRVLSDPEARRAYDDFLAGDGLPVAPMLVEEAEETHEIQIPLDAFEDLEDDSVEFDGARLRRARLRRGLELDDVSRITKINSVYLSFLEEGRFGELPARVYVRGFVAAYASCIGLDPSRVAASYMKGYEAARPEQHRTRFSKSR